MKLKSFFNCIPAALIAMLTVGCSAADTPAGRAVLSIETGDYGTAVSITESAISESGGDRFTFRAKGLALLGQGDYARAKDAFVSALSCSNGIIDRVDIDISYYLAVTEYKMGDTEAARSTVSAITALRPDDDAAYYLLGKIDLEAGDKESALNDFDNTVKLAPTDYDRYVGIYEELHARGYDEDASSYLEQAMTAGSRLKDYNKGVLEYYLGSYTDARNDLENAKKSGNNENLTLYLGRTYEALGDAGYAMSLYREYLQSDPSAGRVYEQLATCRVKNGDYEGALETAEAGLMSGSSEGIQGLMFDKIVAYEMLYDFESAKKCMEEYLKLYPDDETAVRENIFLSSR